MSMKSNQQQKLNPTILTGSNIENIRTLPLYEENVEKIAQKT